MADETLNIHQRILAAAKEIKPVPKDSTANAGSYSYKFRGIDAVTTALREPLLEQGILIVPHLNVDRWSQIDDNTIGVYDIHFINVDDPSDCFIVPALGFGADRSDKGPGKALTYAWRILMEKIFLLATADGDNEDDDIPRGSRGASAESSRPSSGGAAHSIRKINANYGGVCDLCGLNISKGDKIAYDTENKKAAHIKCYDTRNEIAQPDVTTGPPPGHPASDTPDDDDSLPF